MKNLVLFIITIFSTVIMGGLTEVKTILHLSPCDHPIHYRIGNVDVRFKINEGEFKSDIEQAVSIWNNAEGKQLFVFDSQGSLSINLVYDQRQSLDYQISDLENNVENNKNTLDQKIAQYESLAKDFKAKLQDFNNQVSLWNSRGGAPQDVYNALKQKEQELKQEGDNLNNLAKELNLSTVNFNSQVANLNNTIDQFNSQLKLRPEEGIYDGKKNEVDIYFADNHEELVHTLAHELGHAMGLDHNPETSSIMYPYTTDTVSVSSQDLAQIKELCKY